MLWCRIDSTRSEALTSSLDWIVRHRTYRRSSASGNQCFRLYGNAVCSEGSIYRRRELQLLRMSALDRLPATDGRRWYPTPASLRRGTSGVCYDDYLLQFFHSQSPIDFVSVGRSFERFSAADLQTIDQIHLTVIC